MQSGPLRSFLVVPLFAAACGSSASSTPVAQPPLARPDAPGPAVAKRDTPDGEFALELEATGFPAVTGDAANVVLAVMDVDGPVTPPNLRLSVRDRTDTQVHEVVVMTTEQGQAFFAGNDAPVFDDSVIAGANQYLTQLHAERGWFPLAPMTLVEPVASEDDYYRQPVAAQSGDVALAWDEGHVAVTVGGKVVVDRNTQGWLAPSTPPPTDCEDCGGCANPSYLGGAWLDASRKVIVARISYIGTDSCWEPPSQDHVIAWE